MKIKTYSDWQDDLIWCPSQCYKNIVVSVGFKKQHFVIYLRWRHSDPWTADLIPCSDSSFDLHEDSDWHFLSVSDWKDSELIEIKKDAENCAIKKIKQLLNVRL